MAGRYVNTPKPMSTRTFATDAPSLDFSRFKAPVKFGPNVSESEKQKNRSRAKLQRASRRKNRSK